MPIGPTISGSPSAPRKIGARTPPNVRRWMASNRLFAATLARGATRRGGINWFFPEIAGWHVDAGGRAGLGVDLQSAVAARPMKLLISTYASAPAALTTPSAGTGRRGCAGSATRSGHDLDGCIARRSSRCAGRVQVLRAPSAALPVLRVGLPPRDLLQHHGQQN